MENLNLSPELISKAKNAGSAKELIKIAEGEGVKLDEKDAESFFAKLNQTEGELADEELEAVAAGGCGEKKSPYPLHDWEDDCEHQQDALWEPFWQSTCCLCIYSGEDDDAAETVRCHYPTRVRWS